MRGAAGVEGQLQGKEIAFTGRLASMTREEAAELVEAHGGKCVAQPCRRTTMLVIGQEGWPLRGDGHLTRNFEKARALQLEGCRLAILREEEFLEELGVQEDEGKVHKLFTAVELSRLLGVRRDRIRWWVRTGLISPTRRHHGLALFDFNQVSEARALWDLARSGVPLHRIRASLSRLQKWVPEVERSLSQLTLVERSTDFLVRLQTGQLASSRGQLYFDFFEVPQPENLVSAEGAFRSGASLFVDALRLDDEGRLEEAADTYREAMLRDGPQSEACFNLGNVLYRMGKKEPSLERYFQAVELNPEYLEAWNNLGNVHGDLGNWDWALRSYQKALELAPHYADAHYNMAEALFALGRVTEAREHWGKYLAEDPHSTWARHVEERLRETAGDPARS